MALTVAHTFVSAKADDADTTLIRPSNWNATHTITGLGTGVDTFLSTPTSANLAAALTDETGSGALVFGTAPTFTTNLTSPLIIGGTTTTSGITYKTTTGIGAAGANHTFVGGTNGGTNLLIIQNDGSVGIGGSAPTYTLDVIKAANSTIYSRVRNVDAGASAYCSHVVNASGNSWGWRMGSTAANSNAYEAVVDAVGTPVVKLKLDTTGNFSAGADNAQTLGTSALRWSTVYAVTGTINTSDAREKTDIAPSTLGLDFIMRLNPVSYKWIHGSTDVTTVDGVVIETKRPGKRTHFGLLAQDVKKALGDTDFAGWVSADKDDPDAMQSLRYDQMISPIIKALQELKAEFDAYKASHP